MSGIILPGKRNWNEYDSITDPVNKTFLSRYNGIKLISNEADMGLSTDLDSQSAFDAIKMAFPEKRESEIKALLEANNNDLLSVFDILKAKKEGRNKNLGRGRVCREKKVSGKRCQSVLRRLRENRAKKRARDLERGICVVKEETESGEGIQIESEKMGEKQNKNEEPEVQLDWREVFERIRGIRTDEELIEQIGGLKQVFDKKDTKKKRLKIENYILRKGILQRKEMTKKSISENVKLKEYVKFLENENLLLRQGNTLQTQSLLGGCFQDQFGGRPGF